MGGKTRTTTDDETPKGWDHDPPPKQKWTPLGILVVATGALSLIFGSRETSDFGVDGLKLWWAKVQCSFGSVRRLIIYLDNGPHNSGSRTQFLKRMVEFADWSGLEIRLVYHLRFPNFGGVGVKGVNSEEENPMARKSYTREFKLQALRMITEQGLSIAEAARRLGIGENLLRNGKKAAAKLGADAFPGNGNLLPAEDELRKLRAEVTRLRAERDLLKNNDPKRHQTRS